MRTRLSVVTGVLLTVISATFAIHSSAEDDLDRQQKALSIISDFADKLCKDIPLSGSSGKTELSGSAKAELKGIVSKVAELGFEGAAKYSDSKYEGLLQTDLAATLKDNSGCRLQVWNDLKDKLISKVGPAPTLPQPAKVEAFCTRLYHKATIGDPGSWKDSATVSCPTNTKLLACRYWAGTQGNGSNDIASGPFPVGEGCSCTCQHEAKEGLLHEGAGHWCGCYPAAVCVNNTAQMPSSPLEDLITAAISQAPSCR